MVVVETAASGNVPGDVRDLARSVDLGDYEIHANERYTRLIFSRPQGYSDRDREALTNVMGRRALPVDSAAAVLQDGSALHVDIQNQRESTSMVRALLYAGMKDVEMGVGPETTRLVVPVSGQSSREVLADVVRVLGEKDFRISGATVLPDVVSVDVPTMERLERVERGERIVREALDRAVARQGVAAQAATVGSERRVKAVGLDGDVPMSFPRRGYGR